MCKCTLYKCTKVKKYFNAMANRKIRQSNTHITNKKQLQQIITTKTRA